ncbi:MAG TPA: ASCH domain-containing protein [Mollicutes bacterium]|nr:ASCH domain-containing protein [Mollicutes bacterium]
MKAITLKQPWATLIAEGLKEYEFRSWKINYRGEILIHAGKTVDKEAMERFKRLDLEYPKSRIVARVIIKDCIKLNDKENKAIIKENPLIYGDINRDSYTWKLKLIEKIYNKEEVLGKQGIWYYN